MKRQPTQSGVTPRAILLGVLLIPPNAYWLMQLELVWGRTFPSTIPLLSNVVFTLLILVALTRAVQRYAPRFALSQGELLTIYSMLAVATAINGTDVLQTLVHLMSTAYWYATPENEWKELFFSYLPKWLMVSDRGVLQGFFEGGSTLYTWRHIRAWLAPSLFWTAFVVVMLFVMLCLNVILRKRWTEHERLAYPIIELPYQITGGDGLRSIFRSQFLWIGFAVAGGIDVWNGLNYLYPQIPFIPVKGLNVGIYFTERPWNAIGWMPMTFYPFAIGMGFLMPLALSFSSWFFYLFWRAERVFGAAVGLNTIPGFPFPAEQIAGVWIAVLVFALWEGRKYLAGVLYKAFNDASDVDDSGEPLRYRTAVFGLVVGFLFIVVFVQQAGMAVWVAVAFFTIYLGVSLAITRIRAELGPPVQNLRDSGPDSILVDFLGTRRFGRGSLTVMSLFFWINGEAYRSHPMPHQLEGFKLAERANMPARRLVVAMTIASLVGSIAAFWGVLHYSYNMGSSVGFSGPAARYFPLASFRRLARWIAYPTEPNPLAMTITGASFLGTVGLLLLRTRVMWWPLHPIGLAISHAWGMNWFWFPLIIAWATKWAILRHGGVGGYRRALPFFLGLILGEYTVGSLWSILGTILGRRLYAFWV